MKTFREFLGSVEVTALAGIFPAVMQQLAKKPDPEPQRRGWSEGPQAVCRKAEQLLNQTIGEIRVSSGTGIRNVKVQYLCEGADGVMTVELTGLAVASDAGQVGKLIHKLVRVGRQRLLEAGILLECRVKKLYVSECPLGEAAADLLHEFHFICPTHIVAVTDEPLA